MTAHLSPHSAISLQVTAVTCVLVSDRPGCFHSCARDPCLPCVPVPLSLDHRALASRSQGHEAQCQAPRDTRQTAPAVSILFSLLWAPPLGLPLLLSDLRAPARPSSSAPCGLRCLVDRLSAVTQHPPVACVLWRLFLGGSRGEAAPCSLWDLRSLTRDQSHALSSDSPESDALSRQGGALLGKRQKGSASCRENPPNGPRGCQVDPLCLMHPRVTPI